MRRSSCVVIYLSLLLSFSSTADTINGTGDADTLTGTQSADEIQGLNGNDSLTGNGGDDTLNGGSGSDTYYYNVGDGNDVIIDSAGTDKIVFGEGITKDNLEIWAAGLDGDMFLQIPGGGLITIKDWFIGGYGLARIESYVFADGTELKSNALYTVMEIRGTDAADTWTLPSSSYSHLTHRAGKGDDTISGGRYRDTFRYDLGDGNDTYADLGEENTFEFGAGISKDNIEMWAEPPGGKQYIVLSDGAVITVNDWFSASSKRALMTTYLFADGTSLVKGNLYTKMEIRGSEGDDTWSLPPGTYMHLSHRGGKGNDVISGGNYSDYFYYRRGDGSDSIEDGRNHNYLHFEDINAADIQTFRKDQDIIYLIKPTGDTVTVKNWFASSYNDMYETRYLDTTQRSNVVVSNALTVADGSVTFQQGASTITSAEAGRPFTVSWSVTDATSCKNLSAPGNTYQGTDSMPMTFAQTGIKQVFIECQTSAGSSVVSGSIEITPQTALPEVSFILDPLGYSNKRPAVITVAPADRLNAVEFSLDGSVWIATTGGAQGFSHDFGLLTAGDYVLRVKVNGVEDPSSNLAFSVQDIPVTTPVLAPLPATSPDGTVSLSWSGEGDYYVVESLRLPGTDWQQAYQGSDTTVTLTSLTEGDYQFRVKACVSQGCGEYATSSTLSVNYFVIAKDDSNELDKGATANFDVLANDFVPSGQVVSIKDIVSQPQFGTANVVDSDRFIEYANSSGACTTESYFTDSLQYRITNTQGEVSDPATVTIKVNCPGDATTAGVVTSLNVVSNVVEFTTSTAKTWALPGCVASENNDKWAFSATTKQGKATYALLQSAMASAKPVAVESARDCQDKAGIERPARITVTPASQTEEESAQPWFAPVASFVLNHKITTPVILDPLAKPVIADLPIADPDGQFEVSWQGSDSSYFIVEMAMGQASTSSAKGVLSAKSASVNSSAASWVPIYEGSGHSTLVTDLPDGQVQVRAKACTSESTCGDYGQSNVGSVAKSLHANNDAVTLGLNQQKTLYLLNNDFDPDGGQMKIHSIVVGGNETEISDIVNEVTATWGTIKLVQGNTAITYQSTSDQCTGVEHLTDTFSYRMSSELGEIAPPATVKITILCPNGLAHEWVETGFTDSQRASQYTVMFGENALYLVGPPSRMFSIGKVFIPDYQQGDIIQLQKSGAQWDRHAVSIEQFEQIKDSLFEDDAIRFFDHNNNGTLDLLYNSALANGFQLVSVGSKFISVGEEPQLYWQIPDGVVCQSAQHESDLTANGVKTLPAYYATGNQFINWTCTLGNNGPLVSEVNIVLNVGKLAAPENLSSSSTKSTN